MPDLKVRVGGAWQSVTTTGPAGPPGAGGGAHHLTHEVGGADPITGALALTTLTASGAVKFSGAAGAIITDTASGADTKLISLCGGGAVDITRGAAINVAGKNQGAGGGIDLYGSTGTGRINYAPGGTIYGVMHPSGGFSWGSSTDPGTGKILIGGSGKVIVAESGGINESYASFGNAVTNVFVGAENNAGNLFTGVPNCGVVMTTGPVGLGLSANNPTGKIRFYSGGAIERGVIYPTGGFVWGGGADPGANNLAVGGKLSAGVTTSGDAIKCASSTTASLYTLINNAGAALYCGVDNSAGSHLTGFPYSGAVYSDSPNGLTLTAGHAAGVIRFQTTSGGVTKATIDSTGCLMVNTASQFGFNSRVAIKGNPGASVVPMTIGQTDDAPGELFISFHNAAAALQGSITGPTASSVSFNTTSDERLKTDRGHLTDTGVLERTIVHAFDWKTDGTAGRGVFAQEARDVAPFAVTVGTDETDEQGHLKQPWGVDYSKYVPDLIVGWQAHDAKVAALEAKIAKLEAMIEKLLT